MNVFRILLISLTVGLAAPAHAVISISVSAPGDLDPLSLLAADYTESFEGNAFAKGTGANDKSNKDWAKNGYTSLEHGGLYTSEHADPDAYIAINDVNPPELEQPNASSTLMSIHDHKGDDGNLTLTFDDDVSYFGFAWLSASAGNKITFYKDNAIVQWDRDGVLTNSYTFTQLAEDLTILGVNLGTYNDDTQVTDGTAIQSLPYTYVHILAGGVAFNKIVFEQTLEDPGEFQTDDHAALLALPNNPTNDALIAAVTTTVQNDTHPVPEPTTVALIEVDPKKWTSGLGVEPLAL